MIVDLKLDGIETLFFESMVPKNEDRNMFMVFYGIIWEFKVLVNINVGRYKLSSVFLIKKKQSFI